MTSSESIRWTTGPNNLITDVPGVLVGNASDSTIKSGVTVVTADRPFRASVDVMGGAPGTRETDCLAPDKWVDAIDALVLSGGSAFGLAAADGVMAALRAASRGFPVGPVRVPIVPAAIIFDLINGGASDWAVNPYAELGEQAYSNADALFEQGSAGAGTGATTADLKGGLGSASLALPDGLLVGALVVANPHGSTVTGPEGRFWAAPFEMAEEFGGHGLVRGHDPGLAPRNEKLRAFEMARGLEPESSGIPGHMNTTIAVLATNADLSKAELKRLAVSAQDGMARAIVPSHTPFDGDLIFALSTCQQQPENALRDSVWLGHAAALCLSRAIARAVYLAAPENGDTLPCWRQLYG